MTIPPVAPRAVIDRALEHLPKTFDESWLRETWAGGHGRLRLRADIQNVSSFIKVGEESVSGTATVGGSIVRRSGTPVGSVERDVKLHPNGRLGVYHAYLALDDSVQRSGFASRFNERAFERYAEAGVDDVTVTAALSAGGYVWARTGFEIKAPALERADDIADRIVRAFKRGRITQAEFDAIEPRLLLPGRSFDPDVHLSKITELAQMDIGERVLKGGSFDGIRELHPPSNWWAPSSTADSRLGAAYLRGKADVPAGVSAARNAVAALLPEPFDPAIMAARLERATADLDLRLARTGHGRTNLDVVRGTMTGELPMSVVDRSGATVGRLDLEPRVDADGLIITRREWRDPAHGKLLSGAVDDALRGAGVAKVKVPATSAEGHSLLHSIDLT